VLKDWDDNFEDHFKWEIDNGKGIKLWEERMGG